MHDPVKIRSRVGLPSSLLLIVLAGLAVSGPPLRAQAPVRPASLDEILKAVSTYNGGIESAALWTLRDYVYARRDDPAGRADCEAKLLQFLKSSATPAAKLAASHHLRVIGSDTAVPALQALLKDESSADIALYALQQIPGAVADKALVQALSTVGGSTKVAVVSALGKRKVADSVPALAPLLKQAEFAGAAASALGEIGGDAAAEALVASYAGAQGDLKPTLAAAMMMCAEKWLAARQDVAARRTYETLSADASLPAPTRRAVAMGRISAAGSGAAALLMENLRGSDAVLQEAAIARIRDVIAPEAIAPVCALLPSLPEGSQVKVLAVLAGYPTERVLPAVLQGARSSAAPVRIAAMKALESVGSASVVPFLAEAAAKARGPEQAAVRAALGALKGRQADDAILALLAGTPPDDVRGELLLAAADRRIFSAKTAIAAALMSSSAALRMQALRALRGIGTPSDVSVVLDVLLKSPDGPERAEAETTTAALALKTASADGRSSAVKARLAAVKSPEDRVRLIGVLPRTGDNSALPVLRAALKDANADVFDAAVRAFAAWPTSAARDDVFQLARDSRNETHRLLAIRGLIRIVGLDRYRDPEAVVADLRQSAGFSWRPEEQKLVLAALARFPCAAALTLAEGFLREPSVAAEAQAAIDTITERLAELAKDK